MVCVGRATEDGEPFARGLFTGLERTLEDLDGCWFGPVRPPSGLAVANWIVDSHRKNKSES